MEQKILELLKSRSGAYLSIISIEQALNKKDIEDEIRKLVKYKVLKEYVTNSGISTFTINSNTQQVYEGLEQIKKDKENKIFQKMKIRPQYDVLYSDLKNHSIGQFLVSREFKLFMSETGNFDKWKNFYEQVKSHRGYLGLGIDHELGDASNTFALYLNLISEQNDMQDVVTDIISKFIEWKNEKTDFSNVLQTMRISKFAETNIQKVLISIEKHSEKKFSEKDNIDSQKRIKPQSLPNYKDVFIVHGHNEEIKQTLARLVEKLKLNPIILNEQSNEGLTIIEKFEKHSDVSFAIILLTFDDFGYSKKESKKRNKRSRQNVILELGYFTAKLGRKNVLPLYENGVELPSDISGVLYTQIDDAGQWKFRLAKELKTAGFDIDANDIL